MNILKAVRNNSLKEILFSAVIRSQIALNSISTHLIQELLILGVGLSMLLKIDVFHLLHLIELVSESLKIKSAFGSSNLEQNYNCGVMTCS